MCPEVPAFSPLSECAALHSRLLLLIGDCKVEAACSTTVGEPHGPAVQQHQQCQLMMSTLATSIIQPLYRIVLAVMAAAAATMMVVYVIVDSLQLGATSAATIQAPASRPNSYHHMFISARGLLPQVLSNAPAYDHPSHWLVCSCCSSILPDCALHEVQYCCSQCTILIDAQAICTAVKSLRVHPAEA